VQYTYLDQNHWIALRSRPEDDEVREAIEQAVENESIVIPLINTLFRETGKYENTEGREKHFDFMFEMSKGHTLRNYMDIGEFELERFMSAIEGHEYNLEGQVRGEGIAHMYGDWSLEVDDEVDIDDAQLKELEDELDEMLRSQHGFDVATSGDVIEHFQERDWEKELAEEVDSIRKEWDKGIDDNKKRRRFAFYRYFYHNVFSDLLRKIHRAGLYFPLSEIYDFEKYIHEGDKMVDLFLQSFPSRYSYIALNNAKDLQKHRDVKPNDIYDVFSLAVAIPYCDIVVTEKFWAAETKRADLDKIYNTKIFSSLDELSSLID